METMVLYCCTFSKDLLRAKRLAESVVQYNKESLPFFMSVPKQELNTFRSYFPKGFVELLPEEEIVSTNPGINIERLYSLRGSVRQQVIKAEFWRLGLSENYLVLDSDCLFIRDFGKADLLADGIVPYSIIHEGRSFLQPTERFGPARARGEFTKDRKPIMKEMDREGVIYDFGYAPFLWSRKVWQDLAEKHLAPRGKSILDAIVGCPSELTWYGEALLKFRSIPLWPREELFRHYHHEHQYWVDRKLGYTTEVLAKDYLGVVYQSNWQTWEDFGLPNKSWASRVVRSTKRLIKKSLFATGLLGK
jgi:hypothetical protein